MNSAMHEYRSLQILWFNSGLEEAKSFKTPRMKAGYNLQR